MTFILLTDISDLPEVDRPFDLELFSERPTFRLNDNQRLYEGNIDGGDTKDWTDLHNCDADGCDQIATIWWMLDLDPGDLESGPCPNIIPMAACSDDHRDQLNEYMT